MKGTIVAFVQELLPEGFIVTSADSEVEPIMAISETGHFEYLDSPSNVLLHLVQWEAVGRRDELRWARGDQLIANNAAPSKWTTGSPGRTSLESGALSETLTWGPLVTSTWHQVWPYNKKCPFKVPNEPNPLLPEVRRPVGCVATAMVQILNYWKYPASARWGPYDKRKIKIDGITGPDPITYGIPSQTEIDNAMRVIDYVGNTEPDDQAFLSFGVGKFLEMHYSTQWDTSTGTKLPDYQSLTLTNRVAQSLLLDFGYGSAEADDGESVWDRRRSDVIRNIKDGWPVQVSLGGPKIGHSVIIDGFKESVGEEFFHINWGWKGSEGEEGAIWFKLPATIAPYESIYEVVLNICPSRVWGQWKGDVSNSGRVRTPAPETSTLKNKWPVPGASNYQFCGLVIGDGGNAYASHRPQLLGDGISPEVWKINDNGNVEKKIVLEGEDQGLSYPVQNTLGEVFVGTGSGVVYRIDPNTDASDAIFRDNNGDEILSELKIDKDDYLYVATANSVYSIDREGNRRWASPWQPPGNGQIYAPPAVDAERGRVFVSYWDSVSDKAGCVWLSRSSGVEVDSYTWTGVALSSEIAKYPSVAPDGVVLVPCKKTLYALDPSAGFDPVQSWASVFRLEGRAIGRNMVAAQPESVRVYQSYVRADGKYVVGALDMDWRRGTKDVAWEIVDFSLSGYESIGAIHVASNSVVVFMVHYGPGTSNNRYVLYGYRDNGEKNGYTKLWEYDCGDRGVGLAFGPNAVVYVMADNEILALTEPGRLGRGYLNNGKPGAPSNPGIGDGAEVDGASASLSWDCVDPDGHSLEYDVYMGRGEVFKRAASGITGTTLTVNGLLPGQSYDWMVVASDGQTRSPGPTWSFGTREKTPPTCSVSILGGREATNSKSVKLDITYADADSGVAEVQLSNDMLNWYSMKSPASSADWSLLPGEGFRTVYVKVRDMAGNSSVAADSILLDVTAPAGSIVLSSQYDYTMPWDELEVQATAEDPPLGSGLGECRWSWDAGGVWSDWTPLPADQRVPLPRPKGRGRVQILGQFRDVAGNESSPAAAVAFLIEDEPLRIAGWKMVDGAIAPGGDVDCYGIDLVQGYVLSVAAKEQYLRRNQAAKLAFALYDPDGNVVVSGRYPADGRRPGIRKYECQKTGMHWLVLVPTGAEANEGFGYRLRKTVKAGRALTTIRGVTVSGTLHFGAAYGQLVVGTMKGPALSSVTLGRPGGGQTPLVVANQSCRFGSGHWLGETGEWVLNFPSSAGFPVKYSLRLRSGRLVKGMEFEDRSPP